MPLNVEFEAVNDNDAEKPAKRLRTVSFEFGMLTRAPKIENEKIKFHMALILQIISHQLLTRDGKKP